MVSIKDVEKISEIVKEHTFKDGISGDYEINWQDFVYYSNEYFKGKLGTKFDEDKFYEDCEPITEPEPKVESITYKKKK